MRKKREGLGCGERKVAKETVGEGVENCLFMTGSRFFILETNRVVGMLLVAVKKKKMIFFTFFECGIVPSYHIIIYVKYSRYLCRDRS